MGVISKIAEKVRNSKFVKGVCATGAAVATGAASSMTALAAGNLDEGTKTALQTSFESVKEDVVSVIGTALPPALIIVGIGLAITLGVKYFKKFAK